jgi:hypothetical protein
MNRRVPIFILTLLVGSPLAAAPRLKPDKPTVPALVGTSWAGKTAEGWDMTIDFQADGKMTVSYRGSSYNVAGWRQDGEKVYYEMNNKYCEFEGKFVDGAIEGETHNVTGKVWTTRLTKIVCER